MRMAYGPALYYFVDSRMQPYTEPVPLTYGKLATKYPWWIYGIRRRRGHADFYAAHASECFHTRTHVARQIARRVKIIWESTISTLIFRPFATAKLRYVSAGISSHCVSVCLSVCLSVTSRYWIETAALIQLIFWVHTGFRRPIQQRVLTKLRYLQNKQATAVGLLLTAPSDDGRHGKCGQQSTPIVGCWSRSVSSSVYCAMVDWVWGSVARVHRHQLILE